MSSYPHGYTLSPARPSGWGSVFAGVVTVIAVVAVSATSGALVMAELVGSRPDAAPPPSASAMSAIEIPAVRQAAAPAATPAQPTKARPAEDKRVAALPAPAPAPKSVAAPAPAAKPVVAAAPQAAPAAAANPAVAAAPQAAPAAPAQAANPAQVANAVPESELTFTKGYAQRRAAQTAAEQSTPQPTAHAAADHQFGRPAVTQRKPAYARAQEQQRRYAARDSREQYRDQWRERDHYDYRRDRAMAYGDQYQGRRSNGSQGGLFGNLFGGGNLF
jgi:hypothetical protein